jgi:hypothetical protein
VTPGEAELRKSLRLAYFFRFLLTFLGLIFTIVAAAMVLKGNPGTALFYVVIVICEIVSLEQVQASITLVEDLLNVPR